jgi:hypothetical protein
MGLREGEAPAEPVFPSLAPEWLGRSLALPARFSGLIVCSPGIYPGRPRGLDPDIIPGIHTPLHSTLLPGIMTIRPVCPREKP